MHVWSGGLGQEVHADRLGALPAFARVARAAGGDDIVPCGHAAFAARNDMVECELRRFEFTAAILARPFVAQEHIKPRKGRRFLRLDKIIEGDDGWQFERDTRAVNFFIILAQHGDGAAIHGLNGVFPTP